MGETWAALIIALMLATGQALERISIVGYFAWIALAAAVVLWG